MIKIFKLRIAKSIIWIKSKSFDLGDFIDFIGNLFIAILFFWLWIPMLVWMLLSDWAEKEVNKQ